MPDSSPINPTEIAPVDRVAALNESDRRFRLLVDGATNFAMFLIDPDGRIASWNEGARRILGYEEAEVLGQPVVLIFTPEDRENGIPEREIANALRDGRASDQRWHQRKDGTRFWADGIMERLTSETGEIEGFAKVLRDATKEKETEARERARFTQVFEQAPAHMATLRGPQHVFEMTNPPYQQLIGYRDVIGKPVLEALPEIAEQGYVALLDEVYQTGIPYVARDVSVMVPVTADGPLEEFTLDFTYQPLFDSEGHVSGILSHGIDRTVSKQQERQFHAAVDALRLSEERYRTLVDSIDIAFCLIEMRFDAQEQPYDYLFLETNPAFEQHTGLLSAKGKTIRELVPDIDTSWFGIYGKVAITGQPVRFENHDPALYRSFDVYAQRVGIPEQRRVGIFFTDITARKQAQEALRQSDERLREAQTRLEAALSAGDIATWTIDLVNDRVTGDAELARLFSVDPEAAASGSKPLQTYFNAIHEEDRPRAVQAIADAQVSGNDYGTEVRIVLRDGTVRWISSRGKIARDEAGTPTSMFGAVIDITERVERERRERFLTDLTERTRALLDPEEILYEAAKAIGEFTKAHRALYIEIDDPADTLTIRRDYVQADAGIPSMTGTFPLSAFGPPIVASLREGNVTQIVDTETDPRLSPENRTIFRATNFQSFLAVPLHKEGRFVAVLALHYARPRVWTPEEAELLTAVVERTWLAVENARLFRETQQRAEREALLNEIGETVRATLDPEAILRTAIDVLGRRLGVDRCYFVRYDQVRNTGRVSPEWLRPEAGIEPLVGLSRPMSAYSVNRDSSFVEGRTSVVNDTMAFSPEEAAPLLALNVRALMRVPIAIGNQMTALGVAMAHAPRVWTEEDIRLVENVAALLRSSLASAVVQQRERNIAIQLQEALQPPAPRDRPGLALASYYRPALAEASVGGDFFDVFPVGEGYTALVVADLSGKGLAAASQVATVRNMLRYAVYSASNLAEAVTELHRTFVKHDLLTGFATLFVGVYDEKRQSLTYVNCGQEPGLLWRATTGSVERMPPTGPVLGGFGAGDFEESTITLSTGDVLALFTDGLTEVGPSRKAQLEVEGLSGVLQGCCGNARSEAQSPQSVVDCLIAGVDRYARGGVRDDIALLVGVVVGNNQ